MSGRDAAIEDERRALELDTADPLGRFRERFLVPAAPQGGPSVYFAGNSLGLQPVAVADTLRTELESWARHGVDGHFEGPHPWYRYHEAFAGPLARLVGARPDEVVAMNGLTVNLHLLMTSFYRPSGRRRLIVMEPCAFPSDTYAARSQLELHGVDPDDGLVVVEPDGEHGTVDESAFEALLERRGDEVALLLLGGVNYYTGQAFDLGRLARAAHDAGATIGVDLAHAIGNLAPALHDDGIDFAVWCSYKYLNAGPGAVAGAFVHERHLARDDLPRLAGWWGNDPASRFRMHLQPTFEPVPSADAWQLSNPPVLALAPLRASLELFEAAGLPALREKSRALTATLEATVERAGRGRVRRITPRDPSRRGCQLSLHVLERPGELFEALQQAGIVCDRREPNVIRAAPVPLYNGFHDVWRFGRALEAWARCG